jgi:16S rRNA (uracil1498-N3)-methyltransferase
MAERFYVNSPLAPGPVVLTGPEAHHLAAVCRARPGDQVFLFNGDGREYAAEITAIDRRCTSLMIVAVESPNRELGFRLEVAAPLPKGDRAQFLVEKLTELGVTQFIPLRTHRSVTHAGEHRRAKLERYVIEASKQCGRNVLMGIEPTSSWDEFCPRPGLPAARWLAQPGAPPPPVGIEQGIVCAVGPEGGFSPDESELAISHGWQPVGLGQRTLRIETAAIALATWAGLATLPPFPRSGDP